MCGGELTALYIVVNRALLNQFVFDTFNNNMTSFASFALTLTALFSLAVGSNHASDATFTSKMTRRSVDQIHGTSSLAERDPQSRLGFISYGTDATGYQASTNVQPLKIELGGVFVGTLIGLGIVLLAPKVSELFSSPHTPYQGVFARSEDSSIVNSLTSIISKIDESLQENNIDSMSCLERAVCSYAVSGTSGHHTMSFLNANSSNPLVNFVIDGSKLKRALENGYNGENCSAAYPQCSFSKSSLVSGIRSLMTTNSL